MLGDSRYPFLFLPPDIAAREKLYFGYTANFVGASVLSAGGTVTVPINIQADSEFILIASTAVVTATTDATQLTFVPATVQVQYSSSGRNFFDNPTAFNNVYGTAELPRIWEAPQLLVGGGSLSTTLTNLDAANARNVRIVYHGFKAFRKDMQGMRQLLTVWERIADGITNAGRALTPRR